MADNKVMKFGDVVSRVRAYQEDMAAKSAGHKVPETDPAEKGTQAIPVDPESSKKKQNMPEDNTNESNEGKKLEDKDTNPASTGKDKVKTTDGTSKDEAATGGDPTVALSKIASRAKSIVGKLQKVASGPNKNEDNKEVIPNDVSTSPKAKKAEVVVENDKAKKEDDVKAMKSKEATSVAADIDASPEFLFKLASTIIETEGGLEAVEPILRKAAGIEAAQEIITKAASAYEGFVTEGYNQMNMQKQAAAQHAQFIDGINSMLKTASAEEREMISKIASVHDAELNKISHPVLKQAYMQGSADAAAMQDSMGGADGSGGGEPMIPGAEGGAPDPQQIVELLQAMVQAGEIDEQTAQAIVQELMQGAQGGGDPTGGAGGDPTAGAAGDDASAGGGGAPAGGDPSKSASAKAGLDSLYKDLIK